jgi:hypothetical protein
VWTGVQDRAHGPSRVSDVEVLEVLVSTASQLSSFQYFLFVRALPVLRVADPPSECLPMCGVVIKLFYA